MPRASDICGARRETARRGAPIATDATSSKVRSSLGAVSPFIAGNFPWARCCVCGADDRRGNVARVKHAANVSGAGARIESVWRDAGVQDGVVQTLLVQSRPPRPTDRRRSGREVKLNGGSERRTSVAEAAGRVCKECVVIELGGRRSVHRARHDADPLSAANASATQKGASSIPGRA